MSKVITRRGSSQNTSGKVKFNFDVQMLNVLIQYTQCEYIARSDLYNLEKLFRYTEAELYQREVPIYVRICTIQSILKSMIEMSLANIDLIRSQLRQDFEPGIEIIDNIGFGKNKLTVSECDYIRKFINEKLQYIEIYQKKDKLINLLKKIDETADYNVSYYETIQEIKRTVSELMVSIQDNDQTKDCSESFHSQMQMLLI